jgi:hypothetical protein
MDFRQYRHLKRGIEIVEEMGCKKAVKIYKKDPMEFKDLLIEPSGEIPSCRRKVGREVAKAKSFQAREKVSPHLCGYLSLSHFISGFDTNKFPRKFF